ncbi:uncharacterized protein LOC123518361 [Portunus trituberculatus]|uniref:uncharacterized protein LOC123518361 n=1 Tax=Portunus trituberculatus TaxID=210409 RepID=UPI001E1D0BE9|nr:uncharacterized protein LOC123518361 [Portunus trituberculatus]XP_045135076.1 uncharacterized protein LOC123518361 [Portunus trituberculatus]
MMKGTLVAAVVVVVAMVTGGAHGQSKEECMNTLMTSLKMVEPFLPISKMMDRYKTMGGVEGAMQRLKYSMRTCVCSMVTPNPTNDTVCGCIKELEDCEKMHEPKADTPKEEIMNKVTDLMNCMGVDRMSACLKCKEMVNDNPLHMVCMKQGFECPMMKMDMDMKDGM